MSITIVIVKMTNYNYNVSYSKKARRQIDDYLILIISTLVDYTEY